MEWEDENSDWESEPQDLGNMGRVMPEGANRWSNSSITQNKARIGTPDKGGIISSKHAGAAGVDVEGEETHHGSTCSTECSRAKEALTAKVPLTNSGTGSMPTMGRGASWRSPEVQVLDQQ